MDDKLRFEYGDDGETGLAAWTPDLPRWQPCRYEWRPGMWDTPRQKMHGCVLTKSPVLPWEWNVQEVVVQSRKAYELLCRVDRPPVRNPLVRIVPPRAEMREGGSRTLDVLVVAPKVNEGVTAILDGFTALLSVGAMTIAQLLSAKVAVFPAADLSGLDALAHAIACGCSVVSSDANAAEEHLATFARPGSWHVVHDANPKTYREAIKSLLRQDNTFTQTEHKDLTPWMPLTS